MPSIEIIGDISKIDDKLILKIAGYPEENEDAANPKENAEQKVPSRPFLSRLFRYTMIGLHLLVPIVGWIRLARCYQSIFKGQLGVTKNSITGEYAILAPGQHFLLSPFHEFVEAVNVKNDVIKIGPYTILTVRSGQVAITYKDGVIDIKPEGRHLLDSPTHTYSNHVSTKQQVATLHELRVNTADNVPVSVKADVLYQITDPEKAFKEIENIDSHVKERAQNALSSVYMHHPLSEISPITFKTDNQPNSAPTFELDTNVMGKKRSDQAKGVSNIVGEFLQALKNNLEAIGIRVINVGIEDFTIADRTLQEQMGQQAVTWVKTAAALQTAEGNKRVMAINAEAEAAAKVTIAQGNAKAAVIEAEGLLDASNKIQSNPVARQLLFFKEQTKVVAAAKATLMIGSNGALPQVVMPMSNDDSHPEQQVIQAASARR